MRIGGRRIGVVDAASVYVIAEIGVNHDGEIGRAVDLIDAAAAAGADAVKFQYFETDALLSAAAKLAAYQRAAGERDAVSMLRRLELSLAELEVCVERARERGVDAIVSVFTREHVEPVAELGWDALKSASPEVINRPLLTAMADTGLPMIVSTGAATIEEVGRCAGWLGGASERIAMLQCVSAYPVPVGEEGLGGIGAIGRATGLVVGYSDHTEGVGAASRAVGEHGAAILEKHLTWDRDAPGPDHRASLDPAGFTAYVRAARAAAERGGRACRLEGEKRVLACEADVRASSRQSVVARRAIAPGERIGADDLSLKRPGVGVEPWRIGEVIGSVAARGIGADRPVSWADLAGSAAGAA